MQFQSDVLGKPVQRPMIRETTALGAAYLAGLATGVWENKEALEKLWGIEVEFTPEMDEETRAKLVKGWKKAVSRSLDWEEH